MPTNPESTSTDEANEYLDVVNEVWDNRDVVKQARADLKAAKKANEERLTEELSAVQDARVKLRKANDELGRRESEAHEARRVADRQASEAFSAAVGSEYDEYSY